jgi:hypothetical protein
MGIASGNPTWEDFPSTGTPITADSLNALEGVVDRLARVPVNFITSTSYTVSSADIGTLLVMNVSASATVTVPMGVMSVGDRIDLVAWGGGAVTIVGSGGSSVVSTAAPAKTRAQNSSVSIVAVTPSQILVVGDVA